MSNSTSNFSSSYPLSLLLALVDFFPCCFIPLNFSSPGLSLFLLFPLSSVVHMIHYITSFQHPQLPSFFDLSSKNHNYWWIWLYTGKNKDQLDSTTYLSHINSAVFWCCLLTYRIFLVNIILLLSFRSYPSLSL